MFRRRRGAEAGDDDLVDEEETESSDDDDEAAPAAAPTATTGPYDEADAPGDDVPRIDLGALLVPVPEGMEVRVDMQDQTVVAAMIVDGHSAMQIHAFAAPKSAGIWDEVREEIAASLRETGGAADEASGPFGPELRARVPVTAPPGQPAPAPGQVQPMRFVGVDGPRWFLRGLVTGPAATDPNQASRLLDAFRGTIVVRGGEAMAPRDMLPLRLPRDAMPPTESEPSRPGLEMLERGPEITETQ